MPVWNMLETVQARFSSMKVPGFPMANLLVFWGGVQNGFNAFKHNPSTYAKSITCPVLLLFGEKDDRVAMKEIRCIFKNLKGIKKLSTFPLAGHENYLNNYNDKWQDDIKTFINRSDANNLSGNGYKLTKNASGKETLIFRFSFFTIYLLLPGCCSLHYLLRPVFQRSAQLQLLLFSQLQQLFRRLLLPRCLLRHPGYTHQDFHHD